MDQFLANQGSDAYTPEQLFAGSSDVVTEPGILVSGQNLAKYTVVAKLAASGKWTQWSRTDAPSVVEGAYVPATGAGAACGILMHSINATSGDKECVVYTGGYFNTNALVWPASTTDAEKANAFKGTNIQHRAIA